MNGDSARAHRIAVARGEVPAQVILRNAQLVNVLSGDIYPTEIVIDGGDVVALGAGYEAEQVIDLGGRFVCPGFIDAHVHIESSLCTPPEFARAVLAHGVTSVVTDPHEIANVLGLDGIRFMLDRAKGGPINVYVMASSCVPATHMETSGARLDAEDLASLLDDEWVLGLAEMMNYPGVIQGDQVVLDKLDLFATRVLDGHSPAVSGKALNAYVAAGITSDHECTTVEEAREKLRLGLTIFIREGTTTHNLRALLPLIQPENYGRLCFCTDDRVPASLIDEGSIDHMVRVAIANGVDPITAIRIGTINTANYFRLPHLGAIAPGRCADLIVFSYLKNLHAEQVYRGGVLVADEGRVLAPKPALRPFPVRPSINVAPGEIDLGIPARGSRIHVIGGSDTQVTTGNRVENATLVSGEVVPDPDHDILKIAVVERHHATGNVGKAFISGFGLKRGAIAGSVAHDHHNLVVIGADDASMQRALRAVIEMGGGLAAVEGETVLATLALPVAGLMSEAPVEDVRRQYDALIAAAGGLGSLMRDPFMAMSFMALEVIPSLKLTDLGLVDVEQFKLVDLFV